MSRFEGPQGIVTNGLVLNLDAGDPDSYTRSQPPYVEVLVVAGGGGGGANHAGGGGAGGLIYNSAYQLTSAAAVTVTVGAGGGRSTGYQSVTGSNGNNSVFGSLTAIGGGGGGNRQDGGPAGLQYGGSGGSGGGAGGQGQDPTPNLWAGGAGTPGQGFKGGDATFHAGGGGGGAGAPGVAGTTINGQDANTIPGNGGNGLAYSISGTSTYYAGGGGGGGYIGGTYAGTGGLGGGGNGQKSTGQVVNGTANTGGGGGGADGGGNANGGNGGSGIVIVRYPGLPAATGGTITYLNGYTIHTFTTSGTFTPFLWNDVSGNGNNGTLINGVGFNSFQNGGYLSFDGTDDYVINSNFNITPINNELCISLWYNTPNNAAEKMLIDLCGSSNPSSNRDFFSIRQNWSSNGKISCYFNSTTGFQYVAFPNQVVTNTWNNIVYSKVGDTLNAYLNGASVATTNVSGNIQTIQRYIIAQDNLFSGNLWSGIIANVMIYNKGLSQAEVTQNYNAQKSRFGL
jgi:hypothetical protein